MLTFLQIFQTIKDAADIVEFAKDLPEIVNQIRGLNSQDVYLHALDDILKQEQAYFLGKSINFDYRLDVFKKELLGKGVDFTKLPVSPEILDSKVGMHIRSSLLSDNFLIGVDVDVDLDAGWAERITHSVNRHYATLMFDKLLNDSIRQELQYIANNISDGQKIQKDISQLLEFSGTLIRQMAVTDYTLLNSKAVKELFGVSASLFEFDKIKPATSEEIKSFYLGSRLLWWDIIVANGDIERDVQSEILDKYLFHSEKMKMLCVTGEPGSGKSTLAWRIAYEISKRSLIPLITLEDNENGNFWYSLGAGVGQYGGPVVVLVDDIFRGDDALRALRSMSPDMSVIVVSTSRLNEKPSGVFRFEIDYVNLSSPTEKEMSRVYEKTRTSSIGQGKKIRKPASWLMMMYEITAGEKLFHHVRDSVHRLKTQDDVVYRAYEYLCFVGQFDIGVPIRLLVRLDSHGDFYDLPERDASKGLIFYFKNYSTILRPQHSVIAKIALKFYGRNPENILAELLRAVDYGDHEQREYILLLVIRLIFQKMENLVILGLRELGRNGEAENPSLTEVLLWNQIYRLIDDTENAERFEDLAIELVNVNQFSSSSEWLSALVVVNRYKMVLRDQFVNNLSQWLNQEPDDIRVRQMYLQIVTNRANTEQIQQTIQEASSWLRQHPKDYSVRQAFLALVVKGTVEQIRDAIKMTASWLIDHPDNQNVRQTYIGIVEHYGNAAEIQDAIKITAQWLLAHPADSAVRNYYLGLVERKGNLEQINDAIQVTRMLLENYFDDADVHAKFLVLVNRKGAREQIIDAVELTYRWLKNNQSDIKVRLNYLKLASRNDLGRDLFAAVLQDVSVWVDSQHFSRISEKEKALVLDSYGLLFFKLGNYKEAKNVFKASLKLMKRLVPARINLAWAYYHTSNLPGAKNEFMHALWWAENKNAHPVSEVYFNLGKFWYLEHDYKLAHSYYDKAIQFADINFDSLTYHIELGRTLLMLLDTKAISVLRKAIELAGNTPAGKDFQADLDQLCAQANRVFGESVI